jgi:UDPglucose 6-dehydrogenase
VLSIVTPVRVGSTTKIEKMLKEKGLKSLLVCQPMFFTNGCAVEDFNWPDRIILGTPSSEAVSSPEADFSSAGDARGSRAGHELRNGGVGARSDHRICGDQDFLHQRNCQPVRTRERRRRQPVARAGAGQENRAALPATGRRHGRNFRRERHGITDRTGAREPRRPESAECRPRGESGPGDRLMQKVAAAIDTVQNKDVGILGLSFKPNTNSVAGSASLQLAQNLLAGGARVRAYDPVAMPDARLQLNGMVKYCESAYGVAEGVDALIVATGWPEFRRSISPRSATW